MRFQNTETFTFVDSDGTQKLVYDLREIPSFQIARTMTRNTEEDFDEIWSRSDVAGVDMEPQSYALHEANIVQILDAGFDYDRVRRIKIPVLGNLQ